MIVLYLFNLNGKTMEINQLHHHSSNVQFRVKTTGYWHQETVAGPLVDAAASLKLPKFHAVLIFFNRMISIVVQQRSKKKSSPTKAFKIKDRLTLESDQARRLSCWNTCWIHDVIIDHFYIMHPLSCSCLFHRVTRPVNLQSTMLKVNSFQ